MQKNNYKKEEIKRIKGKDNSLGKDTNAEDASVLKESIFAKKTLGQNFLKSQKALNQIIEGAGDLTGKTVLEIGPGMGSLTERLAKTNAKKIILIEMDNRLIPILQEKFSTEILARKIEIVHADILDINLRSIGLTKGNYTLIANIPYYITGAIIRNVIGGDVYPDKAVVLVQKEVAERIVAKDKKESILSVAVKMISTPKIIDKVPRGAFVPSPNVDSAILLLENISKKSFNEDSEKEELFFKILHAGFAHKRKLLKSNLKEASIFSDIEKIFNTLNIKGDARAEILTVEQWKKMLSVDIL